MKPEVLILLSGGVDSTACVNFYIEFGRPICCLFIDYGQPAVKNEAGASKAISRYYSVPLLTTEWKGYTKKTTGLINGRNSFLIAAALLESIPSISVIAIGIHAGTNYPDCSENFLLRMQKVLDLYENGKIHLSAPFVNWRKTDIYTYSIEKKIPIELTYSCEKGGSKPCGNCLSCKDREVLDVCTSKNIISPNRR